MNDQSRHLAQYFSNVGHLLSHLLMLLYPTVVLTLERQFNLSYGELLALSVPGAFLYGICALPAGWLGDRWSAEYMMVIFYVGSGLAAILTGLATGPMGIAIGLTLVGLFGAIYHPVGLAWLVRNAEHRGRALGLNGLFGSIGVGTASLVAASLTALASWRAAFIVPGTLCIVLGVGLWLAVRAGLVVAATQDRKPQDGPAREAVLRAFFVLSVTMLCAGLTWHALTVVMPKLFEQRLPLITQGSTVMVGAIVTMVFALSAATQLLGGWVADRFPLKWAYVISWSVQVPLILVLAYAWELGLVVTMMLVFCTVVISTPVENALLVRYTPGRWRATAFGAKFVLSLGLGSLGLPLVALVHERTGDFFWLFMILSGLALTIAITGLLLPADSHSETVAKAVAVPAE
ncbi:MAG TPA: MFS transporter [Beijerinckiaceae bacterium]|nr:MFS transporter [Beijerinckiaceae bacterium]